MIRFFRSIRQNLLQQGKVSRYIGYAVGEILLIMIGIFLALQLNIWNEGRKDRLEEQAFLKRIHSEVSENLSRISLSLSSVDQGISALEIVAAAFVEDRVTENIEFLTAVTQSSVFSFFTPTQEFPAYDELVSSGKLGLIRNVELRDMLTVYQRTNMNNGIRGDASRGRFGLLSYDLVPRKGHPNQLDDLSEEASSIIVASVLNSELRNYVIPQRNRLKFLERNWIFQEERGGVVLALIEAELAN